MVNKTPKGRPIVSPNPLRGPVCFAPPLTKELLNKYEELAKGSPEAIKASMTSLIEMVRSFQETPESKKDGVPLQMLIKGSVPKHVPLEPEEIDRMWDKVPWDHELEAMSQLFETISNEKDKELRDAAFHLLWFARELALDREPLTQDKL